MTNPHQSPAINAKTAEHSLFTKESSAYAFLFKHFIAFQISFAIVWTALICEHLGIQETLSGILNDPRELLLIPALGFGVWLAHAFLAFFYRAMRRSGAIPSAIVGSVFFFFGMLAFEHCGVLLPRAMAMSLSWTPEYVRIPLYTVLSLSGVCLLTRHQTSRTKTRGITKR